MNRRALIVTGAAGPDDVVNGVLQRAGFAPGVAVPSVALALQLNREAPADLLVVPVQGAEGADLGSLEREIARSPRTFVIATAPAADPELILRVLRAGAHEFLVHPPSADDLAAAVDRLVRRSRPATTSKLTIAVYSAKGGMGTTSVAVNLAFALPQGVRGAQTCLADFVVSGGDVGIMLNLRPAYDVGHVADKLAQLDRSLLASVLVNPTPDVSVLASSERPETLESVDGLAAARILEELQTHFAFTVVDCEHHPTNRTVAALDAVDRVLLVTQMNVAAVRSTQRTLALLRQLGYDDEKILVVANRTHVSDLISTSDAARVLEREIFHRLPNDYKSSETALTRGLPVVVSAPNTPLAKAYLALAAQLRGGDAVAVGESVNEQSPQGSRFGRLLGIGRK